MCTAWYERCVPNIAVNTRENIRSSPRCCSAELKVDQQPHDSVQCPLLLITDVVQR